MRTKSIRDGSKPEKIIDSFLTIIYELNKANDEYIKKINNN